MKLSQPFTGYFPISQKFGENLNSFYKAEGLLGHQGIDFAIPNGTPVLSAVNGTVIAVTTDIQKGEGVAILSSDKFQYNGQDCFMDTIYWHLQDKSIKVKVGDKVTAGEVIGLSNNTGQSTGPHLHFSIIPMALDGSRRVLSGIDNGYRGCINPMPYLSLTVPLEPNITFTHTWNIPKQNLKDFQAKHGLVADGIPGPLTQKVIDSLI